jgi:hypothetical protein
MSKSWIRELLRDLLCCIFQIDWPESDPTGTRPVSQIPWQISAIFCVVAPVFVLLGGGLIWVFADLLIRLAMVR